MSTTKAILMTAMAGVLGALTAAAGGYAYGLSTGQALERGKADADAVQQLTGLLTSHKHLIGQANTASANLRDGTIDARPYLPVRSDGSLYPAESAALLESINDYLMDGLMG